MTLHIDIEHFKTRLLQDALTEAIPHYWLRRATQLEAVGTEDCDLAALNCRRHAALLAEQPIDYTDEIQEALQ